MSPQSLRRTDEVPPPPPSRPRVVALGELLTTRKGAAPARFPEPPAVPRIPIYSHAPSQFRRVVVRNAIHEPVLTVLACVGAGLALGIGAGAAFVWAQQPRTFFERLAALIRR